MKTATSGKVAIASLCILETAAASAQPFFERLGDIAGLGISGDGRVVVGDVGWPQTPCRWTRASGTIVLADPQDLFDGAQALGASFDGSVIVGRGSNPPWAFKWTSETRITALPDLPFGPPSGAYAVSNDGTIIAGLGSLNWFNTTAVRWTPEGALAIDPDPYIRSALSGVSADGTWLVGNVELFDQYGDGCGDAGFIWSELTGKVLLQPEGKPCADEYCPWHYGYSEATAVSADGTVVAGSCTTNVDACKHTLPARWVDGSVQLLGTLPGALSGGVATAVSADGSVIVGGFADAYDTPAFVWTADEGMRDLKQVLLAAGGQAVDGWTNLHVEGLSSDGNVVVGWAVNPKGDGESWVIHLDLPCYPDADDSGTLDLFDFLFFVNLYNAQAGYADCDQNGTLDLFDFLCFVNAFNAGC